MRMQGSEQVILNAEIWPNMLTERSNNQSVRISAVNAESGFNIYLIQVGHNHQAVHAANVISNNSHLFYGHYMVNLL